MKPFTNVVANVICTKIILCAGLYFLCLGSRYEGVFPKSSGFFFSTKIHIVGTEKKKLGTYVLVKEEKNTQDAR